MIILIFLLLWAGRVVGGLAVDDDQLLVVVHMRAPAANVIAVGEEPWPEKTVNFRGFVLGENKVTKGFEICSLNNN